MLLLVYFYLVFALGTVVELFLLRAFWGPQQKSGNGLPDRLRFFSLKKTQWVAPKSFLFVGLIFFNYFSNLN